MEKKFTVDFEVSEELHKQVELMISGGFGVSVYAECPASSFGARTEKRRR